MTGKAGQLAAWAVALAIAAPAPLAAAAEPVVVTPATTEGELNPANKARLEDSLRAAVRKSDLELVEVDADAGQRAAACADEACRASALGDLGGRFLLVPSVALDDQDYRIGLALYGPSGREIARLEETCGLCGLAEAADVMADLGARMGRKVEVATRASAIAITSDPPGAKVFVGDELVGTTPFELPLEAGKHPLRIELDGYIGQQRTVEIVAGETNKLEFELQAVPVEVEPETPRKAKVMSGLGWATLGLGLGAAGGGVALIMIDEKPITSDCSGDNIDAEGNCRWRHATLEPGIGLAVGGAVLLGTSVALLVLARKRSKSSTGDTQARWRPTANGVAFQF